MDRNWITNGRKFTPSYTLGVEQFMEFVKQRSPEHAHISCPCTRCLNQSRRAQAVVHDHLLLFGMSAAYTRWTHHWKSAIIDANVELSRRIHMNMMGFGNLTITMGFMFSRNPMLVTKQSQIWRCYQNCMQPQRRMDSCLILLEC